MVVTQQALVGEDGSSTYVRLLVQAEPGKEEARAAKTGGPVIAERPSPSQVRRYSYRCLLKGDGTPSRLLGGFHVREAFRNAAVALQGHAGLLALLSQFHPRTFPRDAPARAERRRRADAAERRAGNGQDPPVS